MVRNIQLFLVLFSIHIGQSLVLANKRVALVIGNAIYTSGSLKNPIHDALAVGKILQQLDFEVIVKLDVNKSDFKLAIREFEERLKGSGGVGLFYYAGHAIQHKGQNYILPVDAKIDRTYELEDAAIKMQYILQMMEYMQNPTNIIILDACRNNPYVKDFRDMEEGLSAPALAPKGSFIAYATSPGKVAIDGQEKHGLYTQELLKALSISGLTIEQVFKYVRVNVAKLSNNKQIPWENSSLVGEFIFNHGQIIDQDYKLQTESKVSINPLIFLRESQELEMSVNWIYMGKRIIRHDPNRSMLEVNKKTQAFYVKDKGLLIQTPKQQPSYYFIDLMNISDSIYGVGGFHSVCKHILWANQSFLMSDCYSEHIRYIKYDRLADKKISKKYYDQLLEQAIIPEKIKPIYDGRDYYLIFEPYMLKFNYTSRAKLYKRK